MLIYNFTILNDENNDDLTQYSKQIITITPPPSFLSLISSPLSVHSIKSCPKGRYVATLSSTVVKGWTYREVSILDDFSTSSSSPTTIILPGFGWIYSESKMFFCIEWSPTGQFLAIGARFFLKLLNY